MISACGAKAQIGRRQRAQRFRRPPFPHPLDKGIVVKGMGHGLAHAHIFERPLLDHVQVDQAGDPVLLDHHPGNLGHIVQVIQFDLLGQVHIALGQKQPVGGRFRDIP